MPASWALPPCRPIASTQMVRAPCSAARAAAFKPPPPAPTTQMSHSQSHVAGTARGGIGLASSAGNAAPLCSRYVPSDQEALVTALSGTSTAFDPSAAQSPITPSGTA